MTRLDLSTSTKTMMLHNAVDITGSNFDDQNVTLAISLVALGCLFSMLGAALPFLDYIIPRTRFGGRFADFRIATSKPFLASSLGVSAGLLIALVLGDLIPNAVKDLEASGLFAPVHAPLVVTVCLIGGFTAVVGIRRVVMLMRRRRSIDGKIGLYKKELKGAVLCSEGKEADHIGQLLARVLCLRKYSFIHDVLTMEKLQQQKDHLDAATKCTSYVPTCQLESQLPEEVAAESNDEMSNLSARIAISLAIHNFPEGLSNFTAALLSPSLGIIYTIALSLHKIPEGLMMSLPIYYSSKSRTRAFLAASFVSICSQLLGATTAFIFLHLLSPTSISAFIGFTLAAVSGLLLNTALCGILPVGRTFDPTDRYVSSSVFVGVAFFHIVLALLNYV